MQFQVPQFIETEDKIVGPLTLRQFLYLAAAGGASFFMFMMLETFVSVILSVALMATSFSLAFIKINGRPLASVITSAILFLWKPQTYVWRSEQQNIAKEEALRSEGSFLENIISGLVLKKNWRALQSGGKNITTQIPQKQKRAERFEIFQATTGERKAARRVDYR